MINKSKILGIIFYHIIFHMYIFISYIRQHFLSLIKTVIMCRYMIHETRVIVSFDGLSDSIGPIEPTVFVFSFCVCVFYSFSIDKSLLLILQKLT